MGIVAQRQPVRQPSHPIVNVGRDDAVATDRGTQRSRSAPNLPRFASSAVGGRMIGAAHELMLPSHRCEYTFDTEGSDTTTWHTDLGVAAYDTVVCHDYGGHSCGGTRHHAQG